MFKSNVGGIDRIIRIIIGAILVILFFVTGMTGWSWLWLILGLILVVTGALGVCPIYSLIGLSSRKGR